jgi:hypothetical protein
MHGATIKIVSAQQAKLNNVYKDTKLKFLKSNAPILPSVLNYNFGKEQCMLPEDDRMIETCRSVLSVLM